MSGDASGCHNWGGGSYCHLVAGGPEAATHPTMHTAAPTTKDYPAQDVEHVEAETTDTEPSVPTGEPLAWKDSVQLSSCPSSVSSQLLPAKTLPSLGSETQNIPCPGDRGPQSSRVPF